jgi:hypothetical protein
MTIKDTEPPALQGSKKQIALAETIRAKMMAEIDKGIALAAMASFQMTDEDIQTIEHIRGIKDAKTWIGLRNKKTADVFREIRSKLQAGDQQTLPAAQATAQKETQ